MHACIYTTVVDNRENKCMLHTLKVPATHDVEIIVIEEILLKFWECLIFSFLHIYFMNGLAQWYMFSVIFSFDDHINQINQYLQTLWNLFKFLERQYMLHVWIM